MGERGRVDDGIFAGVMVGGGFVFLAWIVFLARFNLLFWILGPPLGVLLTCLVFVIVGVFGGFAVSKRVNSAIGVGESHPHLASPPSPRPPRLSLSHLPLPPHPSGRPRGDLPPRRDASPPTRSRALGPQLFGEPAPNEPGSVVGPWSLLLNDRWSTKPRKFSVSTHRFRPPRALDLSGG